MEFICSGMSLSIRKIRELLFGMIELQMSSVILLLALIQALVLLMQLTILKTLQIVQNIYTHVEFLHTMSKVEFGALLMITSVILAGFMGINDREFYWLLLPFFGSTYGYYLYRKDSRY